MNSMTSVFSLPINPKIDKKFAEETFIPFLIEHKHLIYDLYFTCRIPPFTQDVMGDIFVVDPISGTTRNALFIYRQVFLYLPHLIICGLDQIKKI